MENMFVFTKSEAIDIINFERAVRKMAMRLKVGMTNTPNCYDLQIVRCAVQSD